MGNQDRSPVLPAHLRFIARIYDVLLDPQAWPEILDELCTHTGAKAANLLVSDRLHPEVRVTEASRYLTDAVLAAYAAQYAQYEVTAIERLMTRPAQDWTKVEELVDGPIEDLPSTKWLVREHGILHRVTARLNVNKGWFDAVTVNMAADRGQITRAEAEVGRLFLPHLAKVVEIGRPFQILRARFHAVLQALDRFHLGVLILGPLGHVVIRNREAQRIVELADGLSIDLAGRLRPRDDTAAASLARAVSRALATARADGDAAETRLTVPRRSLEDAFLVEVSPLRGSELAGDGPASGAIVFVIDPNHHAAVSARGMRDLFALTEAEAEVLGLLLAGHGSSEMAQIRGVSPHTVSSQIKSILSKTGTHGRPALVRLALSVNPPVDPAPGVRADA